MRPASSVLLLGLMSAIASAQRLAQYADPMVVSSPSGSWRLRVDPTSPWGSGPAHYDLAHDGVAAWSGDLDVLLRDVAVADDGVFAGAVPEQRDGLHLFVVGRDGAVRFHDVLPPEVSVVDGPTYPLSGGVQFLGEGDEVRFGVLHDTFEEPEFREIRRVRASTGEWLGAEAATGATWPGGSSRPQHPAKPSAPAPTPLDLELVGSLDLQVAESAAGESWAFDLDDRGRMGRSVQQPDGAIDFELRDADGTLVQRIALHILDEGEVVVPGCLWLQDDRWLLYTTWPRAKRSHAWWLDVAAGQLTPVEGFACPPIKDGDGTGDGGFVLLTYDDDNALSCFDAQGKLRWSKSDVVGQNHEGLVSPEDVCVSPRGEIGLVDSLRHDIERFDPGGHPLGALSIDEAIGRRANYPADLGVDAQGDWIVCDFRGEPPVLRLSHEGQLLGGLTPRFADGRVVEMRGGVLAAPDGHLWTSDAFAGLRLDVAGVVDSLSGVPPVAADLGQVEGSYLDANGRVALADRRTHAIHVFDATGRRVSVAVPPPDVPAETVSVIGIALDPDQRLHACYDALLSPKSKRTSLVFESDGPLSRRENAAGPSLFLPGKASRWVLGWYELQLLSADGEVLRRLMRTPDDRWLGILGEAAVAPDGSLVVAARDRLHVYAADGTPVASLDRPDGARYARLAFDGTRVLLTWLGDLWEVEVATGQVRHATPAEIRGETLTRPAWHADGKTLLILDEKDRRVLHFAIHP